MKELTSEQEYCKQAIYIILSGFIFKPVIKKENGYLPGIHLFLAEIFILYSTKTEFCDSLLTGFMQAFLSMANGTRNPWYPAKVVIFFLALAESGYKRNLKFVFLKSYLATLNPFCQKMNVPIH